MANTYESFAEKSTSEKLVLCWLEPFERMLLWTLDSGAIYKRTANNFVIDILEGTTSLIKASSSSLTSGQWFYDSATGEVYIRTSDDSDPSTKNIVATYRLFYANAPIDLPYDLNTGTDVHYEGVLKSNSPVIKALDDENTGIALESNTNLVFENDSGLFDDIYDVLFFENKRVRLYSFNENILLSEKKLIFDGIIQDKAFTTSQVKFKCKDFVYKLRRPVGLDLFTTSDGELSDSLLNTPKRRIYGQADKVKCAPIDNILDGYTLTGILSGTNGSLVISGTGTAFLDECSPSDVLKVPVLNGIQELSIESVDSDTQITLSDEIETEFNVATVSNAPARPWRKKNRRFHIAGHKLREPTTSVNVGTQPNRFSILNGDDLFSSNVISVDGENAVIKRITGTDVTLTANLQSGTPVFGNAVIRSPLSAAYYKNSEIFINRDWTLTNTTEAILELENDLELNIAKPKKIEGSVTFTNGSRSVTRASGDFRNDLNSRDWIRSSDLGHTVWYEVLAVEELSLTLRIAYAGANNTGSTSSKKLVDLIEDDSLITCDCIGMENASVAWVKTASDVVNDLIFNDAEITNINTASFTQADIDAPYIISMVIPETIGGSIPKIRDVISKINDSIFGSLINNTNWEMVYNVLTPDKPTDIVELTDHDIIGGVAVNTRNKVVRKINLQYSPFVDIFTGEDSFKLYEFTNQFVDDYIQSKDEKDSIAYLYNDSDAQEIAERLGLYNSLSQSTVTLRGKMNFMLKNLNDKIYLSFERLYRRFGGKDRRRLGAISKIVKNGSDTTIEVSDFGNVFNRILSVAPNDAAVFTSATESEKIINSYILDDDLHLPDTTNEDFLGTNLIG